MKYKKHDRVVIKPWKLMEKEFGLTDNGHISGGSVCFLCQMERALKGTDRVIELGEELSLYYKTTFPNGSDWNITDDHILGYAFEYGEEIEVSDGGKNWYKAIFSTYHPRGGSLSVMTTDTYYKHARPIRTPDIKITVEYGGEKLTPDQIRDKISADTWNNFHKGD